eukprot:m.188843 g.188843  ORF g.188843 m.188843 type:complete len:231 (-) comp10032_c1_seq8:83-775(-)
MENTTYHLLQKKATKRLLRVRGAKKAASHQSVATALAKRARKERSPVEEEAQRVAPYTVNDLTDDPVKQAYLAELVSCASDDPPLLFNWHSETLPRFCALVDVLRAPPAVGAPVALPPWLPPAVPGAAMDPDVFAAAFIRHVMQVAQPGKVYNPAKQGTLVIPCTPTDLINVSVAIRDLCYDGLSRAVVAMDPTCVPIAQIFGGKEGAAGLRGEIEPCIFPATTGVAVWT